MALEDQIGDLIAAVEKNTAAVEAQTALMKKMAGGAKAAADDAPADEDKPKARGGKAVPAKAAGSRRGKKAEPTEQDVKDLFGSYISAAGSKAEKARLNATLKPILEHFGADRITEIDPADWPQVIQMGQKLKTAYEDGGVDAAEDVDLGLSNEDEDEDDDNI